VDAFNTQVAAVISELSGDGLRVKGVDNNTALNYGVDMDGAYHPVNTGHAKIEAVWQAAFSVAPKPIFTKLGGVQSAGAVGTSILDWRTEFDKGTVRYNPTYNASGGMGGQVATFKGN
jgi:hypothetical protein